MIKAVFVFLAILSLAWGQAPLPQRSYDYNVELGNYLTDGHINSSGVFHLYYSIRNPLINIAIVADTRDTTGWAAFGFSSSNLMYPGDAAVGLMDGTTPRLGDFYLSARAPATSIQACMMNDPGVCLDSNVVNGIQCVDNLSNQIVTRTGTYLVLEYSRPINASDTCDISINLGGANHIIYAVGPAVSTYTWPLNFQYHIVRANISFAFNTAPIVTSSPTSATTATTATTAATATTANTTAATTQTVAPTMPVTTGAPLNPPPTLAGYANQMDFSNLLTNGFNPAPAPQYFHIYYTYSPPTLYMGIVAYSIDGWVGFGWSPTAVMELPNIPSDAMLAYVDQLGQTFVTDFVLYGKTAPSSTGCPGTNNSVCSDLTVAKNCLDNLNIKSISRNNGYLTVEFSRPTVASDICDVAVLPAGSANQNVIYAVGPTVVSTAWPYAAQFHTYHTNGKVPFNWIVSGTGTTAHPNIAVPLSGSFIVVILSLMFLML